jgi:type IV secretory pathway VirB10-like protein
MITALPTMLACGCLLAIPALGETYKWTDAEGKVHYSDQPPPANVKQSGTVKSRSPAAPTAAPEAGGAPAATPKTYPEQEAEFNRRRVEAAEKEAAEKKAAETAAEKKRNCALAKAELARVQSGGRIARVNEKGEPVYLKDSEIGEETVRAKRTADAWCK